MRNGVLGAGMQPHEAKRPGLTDENATLDDLSGCSETHIRPSHAPH